jgi:hypothetical protein
MLGEKWDRFSGFIFRLWFKRRVGGGFEFLGSEGIVNGFCADARMGRVRSLLRDARLMRKVRSV